MTKNMRVDKFLSQQTVLSRKEIKKLAKKKRIAVNQEVIKKTDIKIDPMVDTVTLDGIDISYEPYIYYVLNKPQGVVSATWDNQWPTVIDLLPPEDVVIYEPAPVGRLDKDTTGLLIVTNDGQLNHQIVSPNRHVEKEYRATISGRLPERAIERFAEGIVIDGNEKCLPAQLMIEEEDASEMATKVRVILLEGKYHQVKRMFQALNCEVMMLERIRIGAMTLPSDLALGDYKKYSYDELNEAINKK
ncbi:pseudouridine synthase [Aerococcus suis]